MRKAMSLNRNRFEGVERGRPLRNSRAIAGYVWDDETKWRRALRLDREQLGLSIVVGELFGYSGWVDHGLAEAAGTPSARRQDRRRTDEIKAEAEHEMA
jgi:hypothetical protein